MSRRLSALVVAGALVAAIVSAPADARHQDFSLHRDGRWLKDAYGRVVLLHGVNTVWKVAPYLPPDEPGGITDADMALMAAHGWNTVRLGVIFTGLMPQKGVVDGGYLDAVVDTIDRFGQHGIHVLLDIHQDLMAAPWGSGFPDWAVSHTPALEAAEPDLGFPLNALRPSHNLAWDFFWRNGRLAPDDPQGVVDYLGDALAALAERVAANHSVLGIEIINEPWPGTPFVTCVAFVVGCLAVDQYVQRTWQYLTDRMRAAAGSDLLVWWEPNVIWNETVPSNLSSPPLTPTVTDSNLGFSFHDYCGLGELATYSGLPRTLEPLTCDLYHDRTWTNYDTFVARTNWPALVTEFGNSSDGTELERSLSRADARLIGWHVWHYGSGFGLRDDPGEPFSAEQLQHLVRTYPRAIAGTPLSLSFDPESGRMVFTYRAERLGVPTEIAVSDVHYADGYEVTVTGGRVTSADGASVITIVPSKGATVIRVVVSARVNNLAIRTTGLQKRFGSFDALHPLDLEVEAGEVFGYLGPNGAGKTVTIRLLLGLLRPTGGRAEIFGIDSVGDPVSAHARLAYVPGDATLWPSLTGAETLHLLGRIQGRTDDRYCGALVERFALDPSKKIRTYSKGNRQKVVLIAALASRAELLVLDEPTSGLDPLMEQVFRETVTEAKAAGQTVFLSSHILSEVEALCDRVAILRVGRVVEVGTLKDLRHLSALSVEATFPGASPDLSTVTGVSHVEVFGSTVRCRVDGDMAPLLAQLAAAGAVRIISREPSLEELFLAHYGVDPAEGERVHSRAD